MILRRTLFNSDTLLAGLLVIADTGLTRYPVQLGRIDLLHSLSASVTIPIEVVCELGDPKGLQPFRLGSNSPRLGGLFLT